MAFLPRDEITVSFSVVANPVSGSTYSRCETSKKIDSYEKEDWWIFVGGVERRSEPEVDVASGEIRCSSEPLDASNRSSSESLDNPYLIAGVSVVAKPLRQMEDERIIAVEVSLSLQERSGFGKEGTSGYEDSEVSRAFLFGEEQKAFVPLLIATKAQQEELGVHEIFLNIAVGAVQENSDTAYGGITVISDLEGADLLLDGGVVNGIAADGETVLRNVRTGPRELAARDPSGQETRKAVEVKANRTVIVDLSPMEPASRAARFRLVHLGKNAEGYEEYRREADGAVVVEIPAGEFLMGNVETERSPLEHHVYLSDFLIDKTGVTWGQFKKFAGATATPLPPHEPYWGIRDDHPMVYVTWQEAKAYCEWVGGRLPTEAEREKAARGTDGRKYPWGNEEPDPERAVYRRTWGHEATAAVGTHPAGASPYGPLDMAGNVWEWCSDWYDENYYSVSPYRDPKGPSTGRVHVVRGGSWDSRPSVLSASCRSWGHLGYRDGDFGFRCAMNAPR